MKDKSTQKPNGGMMLLSKAADFYKKIEKLTADRDEINDETCEMLEPYMTVTGEG
jgi:hypothetical protein